MQTFYAVLFILYIYISPAFNKRAGFTYESHATHSRGLVHHEFIPETDQNSPDTLRSYVNRLHGEPVKISYCELDAEMRIPICNGVNPAWGSIPAIKQLPACKNTGNCNDT